MKYLSGRKSNKNKKPTRIKMLKKLVKRSKKIMWVKIEWKRNSVNLDHHPIYLKNHGLDLLLVSVQRVV